MATADRAEVEIRGKWYPVRVVKPTFVRPWQNLDLTFSGGPDR
ncbi:hypothetical protein AB1J88_00590 [Pseudomonas sp. S8]